MNPSGNQLMVKGGPSLNPSGRPKGFAGVARMIMKETRDGAELVEWALCIWRDVTLDIKDRAAAFSWLSDRGLGKPVQMTELGPPGSFTDEDDTRADGLSLEQLRALAELDRRRDEVLRGSLLNPPTDVLAPESRLALPSPVDHRDTDPKVLDGDASPLAQVVVNSTSNTDGE